MQIEKTKLKEIYCTMLKIRYFEEKARELFTSGEIPGFLHSYLGEEAVEDVYTNQESDEVNLCES